MRGLHLMCLSQRSDWKGRGERKIGELNERRGMEKEGVKGEIRMWDKQKSERQRVGNSW